GPGGTPAMATQQLCEILSHPSATFLDELQLGPAPSQRGEMSMQCLVEGLGRAYRESNRPRGLRTLYLGNLDRWDISQTDAGDFGAIAKLLPSLRDVTIHAGNFTLGELDLPELRSFAMQTGQL